jgi:hypothetical protein
MNRRKFVVLLGAVAGCNAVPTPDRRQETPTRTPPGTPTDAPTATPTESAPTATPTETATEEPPPQSETETETATPTQAERLGAERLEAAAAALTDVVDTFTGEYGSELTAVTADSTEFTGYEYELQVDFAAAQEAYVEARNAAANPDQRRTADRMRGCWKFLVDASDTQFRVVEGYERLAAARDAFENVEPDAAGSAVEDLATKRRQAASEFDHLQSESSVDAAAVIGSISAEEYEKKLSQFDADIGIYRDLDDTLQEFVQGIEWFKLARVEFEEEDRNVQNAEEKADNAREVLSDVSSQLDDMVDDAADAATLVPILKSLRSIASEKAETAADMDN